MIQNKQLTDIMKVELGQLEASILLNYNVAMRLQDFKDPELQEILGELRDAHFKLACAVAKFRKACISDRIDGK